MSKTSHLTEADVAAVLDASAEAPSAHARGCAACRALIESARADRDAVAGWLRALDHPVPIVDVRSVLRRAAPTATARTPRTTRVIRIPLWTAAALMAGVTVAAAAMLPNSPVRTFVERMTGDGAHTMAGPPPQRDTTRTVPTVRGVAIVPASEVTITFDSAQWRGDMRVAPSTGAAMTVESDADGPTYTVGADMIVVHNRRTDTAGYHVLIPSGRAVHIMIAGRSAYRWKASTTSAGERSPALVVPLGRDRSVAH